jgi:thiamine kinase-like enzyme
MLEEMAANQERLEVNLGHSQEFQKKVEQKVGEKDTSLHGQIKELESEKEKVECAMRDVKEYYEKCQQSYEKIKCAVRDVNKGLEEQLQITEP